MLQDWQKDTNEQQVEPTWIKEKMWYVAVTKEALVVGVNIVIMVPITLLMWVYICAQGYKITQEMNIIYQWQIVCSSWS